MKIKNYLVVLISLFAFYLSGCKKDLYNPATKTPGNKFSVTALSKLNLSDSAMVITPFGPRRKSDVHLIVEGHSLKYSGGHLVEVETATGKMLNDFGVQAPLNYLSKKPAQNASNNLITASSSPPAVVDTNWKTWAQGTTTKQGIFANLPFPQTFTTSWTVPSLPTTLNDGQVIFIFDGLEDSNLSMIMQPVLQYGYNGYTGNATSWTIANYYATCAQCTAYVSTPVSVNPGDALVGQIQQTGQSGSNTWTSSFYKNGQLATSLTQPSLTAPLTTLFETIEAVNVKTISDYPPNDYVEMDPNAGNPVKDFVAHTGSTARLGEQTVFPNNTGFVDLYFHLRAPAISYTTPIGYTVGIVISPLTPTNTGSAATYTVSPALPAGLTINTATGVITGTPTTVSASTNYTVTATNHAGTSSKIIAIQIWAVPVLTVAYGGYSGFVILSVTPNIPSPVTGNFTYKDLNTGISTNSANSPYGYSATYISGHTYQFYVTEYGNGSPTGVKSNTVTYTVL